MMLPKIIVVHIGTHKTGTKSTQSMLHENAQVFGDQGLYYPTSGRLAGGGHHNLAWELTEDPRFESKNGSLDDLLLELKSNDPRAVLLSSEDFESLHRSPVRLEKLRSSLADLGYQIRILSLLREPGDYAASLFEELQKHGLEDSPTSFVSKLVETGGIAFRSWDIPINYAQLLDGFASVVGASHVHAVSYEQEDSVRVVLKAASRILGLSLVPVEDWSRHNARISNGSELPSARGATLSADQVDLVRRYFGPIAASAIRDYPLPDAECDGLTHSFSTDASLR